MQSHLKGGGEQNSLQICPYKHRLHGKWKVISADAEVRTLLGGKINIVAQEGKTMPSGSCVEKNTPTSTSTPAIHT